MSAVKLVCEEFFTVYTGGSQSALPKRLLEMSIITPHLGLLNQGPASARDAAGAPGDAHSC